MAAHDDVLGVVPDFAIETAMDAVPFEQMGEGLGVGEIVDGGDLLDLGLASWRARHCGRCGRSR